MALVVKMLETEIHLFRYSAIPLFLIPRFTNSRAMVILLSFLTLLSSLSIGMRKQLASPQHSIHGVNREVNAPAVL